MMILSTGQLYCVRLCKESNTIQLDIILDKSTEKSAENRKALMEFFVTTLEQIRKEIMGAAKKPICYVPCPHCPNIHIRYTNLFRGGDLLCQTAAQIVQQDYYQDLIQGIAIYLLTYHKLCIMINYVVLQVLVKPSN